jgi:hypothetical protein
MSSSQSPYKGIRCQNGRKKYAVCISGRFTADSIPLNEANFANNLKMGELST